MNDPGVADVALNPLCTPGQVVPDPAEDGAHAALCGCGWSEGGFPSRSAAKRAQRAHRFPPRTTPAVGGLYIEFSASPQDATVDRLRKALAENPCLGGHRPAWLNAGGVACGVCGVRL